MGKTKSTSKKSPKKPFKKASKPRVVKHKSFLQFLKSASPQQRQILLTLSNHDQFLTICECAANILRKNVSLTNKQLQELRKHKTILYKISDPHLSLNVKKKILNQKGGIAFLPALLAPIIGGLIGSAISG